MLTFLFWNIHKKDNLKLIGNLVKEKRVDFLLLAECSLPVDRVLGEINRDSADFHANTGTGLCKRITIYSKFSDRFVTSVFDDRYFTIRKLNLPVVGELLLAIVHLPIVHQTEFDQAERLKRLSKDIAKKEKEAGHRRTVLVGDFNMNPFEKAVIAASGLHATMDKRIAAKGQREHDGVCYPFFYNPMWSLFGDVSPGPPGTYYYSKGGNDVYFWNMFDQVLLRPDVLPMFNNGNLAIVDKIGDVSLLKEKDGTPNVQMASDHLPVIFQLKC